jgi:hypothetical protein
VTSPEFEAISPGLPSHQDEVMASHQGQPAIAGQDKRRGAGLPAEDRGQDETAKYGSLPSAC